MKRINPLIDRSCLKFKGIKMKKDGQGKGESGECIAPEECTVPEECTAPEECTWSSRRTKRRISLSLSIWRLTFPPV